MPELAEVQQNEKVVAEEPVARIEDDDDDDSDDDIPDLEDASKYIYTSFHMIFIHVHVALAMCV